MLSSPTVSHDDEDQHSDGPVEVVIEEQSDTEQEKKNDEAVECEDVDVVKENQIVIKPLQLFFGKRDILELSDNIVGSKHFVQHTVLPDNNVNCFFQNRAQYWRLSSGDREEHTLVKCSCCDFTYPSTQLQLNQQPMANKSANVNAVTDSLKTFLKNNEEANVSIFNNNKQMNQIPFDYQMQQQPSHPPQKYQLQNNGFYQNNGNCNQSLNPYSNYSSYNNNSGYGNTIALLNLMNNASHNATSTFQAMSSNNISNTSRYFNSNSNNNGYGLY